MKLYRPVETEYEAKAQKSVMLAGAVICLGVCMAFTVMGIDMLTNSHTVAGCIILIPAICTLIAGIAFLIVRGRYGKDLTQLRKNQGAELNE